MPDNRSEAFSSVLAALRDRAELLASAEADPLALVEESARLHALADELIGAGVDVARDAGVGWDQLGDVLGTSPQGAFQRFGHPVDPRTDREIDLVPLADADTLALNLIHRIVTADFTAARADFDDTMRRALSVEELGDNWAEAISMVGAYSHTGCPRARRRGPHTVVDTPLTFEAGELTARITFDGDARVAGLFFLDPEYARRH
ncbi:DUF3887 domain-containing protein [Rhodococcus sp. D2-41]|uniref:DUF3887 domain-containing protein n=1 Tax=Speluncibacter jeojiensis TaxID=2710754 RepID=A0A9X4M1I8_9ACTN|nr:DUF3887 domain-containing protein [Rhodococcus sp. D2-41]MDG3011974.1 DUF3887 domain-containing protein [Rhodococcus sp. D2-41]MDG3013428.1 DUF3887 domain-containing protein [Corynebacteriales bacterium D3-21]